MWPEKVTVLNHGLTVFPWEEELQSLGSSPPLHIHRGEGFLLSALSLPDTVLKVFSFSSSMSQAMTRHCRVPDFSSDSSPAPHRKLEKAG